MSFNPVNTYQYGDHDILSSEDNGPGNLSVAKNLTVYGTDISVNSSSGAFILFGGLSISNTENSSSYLSGGSITTSGGASIAKSLYIGEDINVLGDFNVLGQTNLSGFTITGTESSLNSTTGAFVLGGGISIYNTTEATSPSSGGTITTAGGVSIGKNLYIGGTTNSLNSTTGSVILSGGLSISNTENATSTTQGGSLTVAGGLSIAKDLYVGGSVNFTDFTISGTADSINSTTAALVLSGGLSLSDTVDATSSTAGGTITTAGGVAIAKSLYVGGTSNLNNIISSGLTSLSGTVISGTVNSTNTLSSLNSSTGSVVLSGGLSIRNTTDATSPTAGGTITTAGGVGVAGTLFLGGLIDGTLKVSRSTVTLNNNTNFVDINPSATTGVYYIIVSADYANGPNAIFVASKSVASVNSNPDLVIRSNGSSGERLTSDWLSNNKIRLRFQNTPGSVGSYSFTVKLIS